MTCPDVITISSQDEIQCHLSALCPDGVITDLHSSELLTPPPNLTEIGYLETDASTTFDNLTDVIKLRLTRVHELPSIKFIGTLNVTGPTSIRAGPQSFAVNNSLIVGPSPPWYYDDADPNRQGEVTFFMGDVKTVGSDAKIIGNSDLPLDFGGLESIGGNLILSNNRNCTVDFGQLSAVTNLSMVDSVDTVLPALLKLENAMNIHLRGYIDTFLTSKASSIGSNIFPNLVLVRDTVTIEAWNNDFNCSKLISQRNDHTINKLICNGTDNETYGGSKSSSSSTTLTKGAWAGIAVGIVIVVSVLVGVAVWSVLGFRRLLKALATRDEHRASRLPDGGDHEQRVGPGVDGGNNSESREMDGRGII